VIDENHQILECELTIPEMEDPTVVPNLLAQIDTSFETFMGDGAYDGEPVSQAILNKQPDAQVVVPPHKNAVCSDAGDTQRDQLNFQSAPTVVAHIPFQHRRQTGRRRKPTIADQVVCV
jgi:hypothetical protein